MNLIFINSAARAKNYYIFIHFFVIYKVSKGIVIENKI